MRIICPNCSAEYDVTPEAIGANGRMVRCASCSSQWFQAPIAEATADDVISEAADDPRRGADKLAGAIAGMAAGTGRSEPGDAQADVYHDVEPARASTPLTDSVDEARVRSRSKTESAEELVASLSDDEALRPRSGGAFLAGFSTVTLVALILIAVYVKAPELAEIAPAAKGPLASYTDIVNQGRVALAEATGG